MALRLVFVHGIGGPREAEVDRECWISALADGGRRAGHSRAAESLGDGSLGDVVFAYYGDLFERAQAQGPGGSALDAAEAAMLVEILAEIAEQHRDNRDGVDQASVAIALAMLRPDGEAQGAAGLVRRATNAATTLLGAGPWEKAGQWTASKLLIRDLAQVARYLARGEPNQDNRTLDARIRDVVADALGPGPAVVVAHSLGTVVTFETLHAYRGVIPLWVTLGSPLAMRAVVWPRLRPSPPATPPAVRRWLNYWDRDDIITARPILESDFCASDAGVRPESTRVDSDGLWVHSAVKYLAKADVAGPVIEALEQRRRPA